MSDVLTKYQVDSLITNLSCTEPPEVHRLGDQLAAHDAALRTALATAVEAKEKAERERNEALKNAGIEMAHKEDVPASLALDCRACSMHEDGRCVFEQDPLTCNVFKAKAAIPTPSDDYGRGVWDAAHRNGSEVSTNQTHEQRWHTLGYDVKWNDLHRKYEVKWVEETSLCSVLDRTFCSILLPTVQAVDEWISAREAHTAEGRVT